MSALSTLLHGYWAGQLERRNSDPYRIDPLTDRQKSVAGDYIGNPHTCAKFGANLSKGGLCANGGGEKCDAFRSVDQTDQKQKYSRFLAWKTIAHRSLYKETGDDVSNDVVRIFTRSIMEYVQVYVQWKYRAKNNLKCRQIAEIFNLITQNQCRWERRQHQSSDRK